MSPTTAPLSVQLPDYAGSRCNVRPFRADDFEAYHAMVRLPAVSQHMNWQPHRHRGESEAFLQRVLASYGDDFCAPWCISDAADDVCCGFVGFSKLERDHRRADLAVALHPSAWGKGMARQACAYLLAQAPKAGVLRLQAVVEVGNAASERLMDGLGPQEKTRLGHYIVGKTGPVDAYLYAWLFAASPRPAALP